MGTETLLIPGTGGADSSVDTQLGKADLVTVYVQSQEGKASAFVSDVGFGSCDVFMAKPHRCEFQRQSKLVSFTADKLCNSPSPFPPRA